MKIASRPSPPRFCATLWSLEGHPTRAREWTIERKLTAIAAAGFDGVHDVLAEEHHALARQLGLTVIGRLDGRWLKGWKPSLQRQLDAGVTLFNVHLGLHDTPPERAARAAAQMVEFGRSRGACVQIETHRATATETPEKFEEIQRHFRRLTGRPMPTTWDHSHFAVMKHLLPEEYAPRLLAWPKDIQASRLLHCRPFNSQHCQIPATNGRGRATPEFNDYIQFVRALFTLWQSGPQPRPPLWICPELGTSVGYHVSTNPPVWPDTVYCLKALKKAWRSPDSPARISATA